MSDKREIITAIVSSAIDEINLDLVNKKISKLSDSEIYGHKDLLDSFELVNFIVLIEEKIEDKLSITVSLTDDRALSQDYSPFGTVGTLIDYVTTSVNEQSVD